MKFVLYELFLNLKEIMVPYSKFCTKVSVEDSVNDLLLFLRGPFPVACRILVP